MIRKLTFATSVILSLAACSFTPEYVRPTLEAPTAWEAKTEQSSTEIAKAWWESFGDESLNALMLKALSNNTDITAGIQVVEQSRAALKIAGASLFPSLAADGGASKTFTDPDSEGNSTSKRFSAGFSASYELDLFGRNRARKSAAQADLLSSVYAQDALALLVMGDVAQTYFTMLNLRERLAIADQNLANRQEVLRIVQARVREGAESDLELAQQKTLVASAEASRAQIIEFIANAKNSLAVLLGQAPQGFELDNKSLDNIKVPDIAIGQPSELLERRPDLKAAETKLISANADIGAAKAAFYPSLTLGLDNTISISGLADPSTRILALAGSITAPIFQGGSLQGGLEQATAAQLELVENYRGAVYNSFREVEDALAAVKSAQEREKYLLITLQESSRAYAISKESYDAGAIDFQTLLDTQISLLTAEDSYAQARLARLTASVSLYKAMGGGWQS